MSYTFEECEYVSQKLVHKALLLTYENFKNSLSHLTSIELFSFLARQGEGRAKVGKGQKYHYKIAELIEAVAKEKKDKQINKELICRIVSSSFMKVALERYVQNSIISFLLSNKINYEIYLSPNSSDFSIILKNDSILLLMKLLELNLDLKLDPDFEGIILHVDSKSLMALSNSNDALTSIKPKFKILGKCEAKWNQITYEPPLLREAQKSSDSNVLKVRHKVLSPTQMINNEIYFVVTTFVCGLSYLEKSLDYFDKSFMKVNGNDFTIALYGICIPNYHFQNDYYDSFFQNGKGGYDKDDDNFPLDCRFAITNAQSNLIEYLFKNKQGRSENRYFHILSNSSQEHRCLIQEEDGNIVEDIFYLP